MRRKGVGEKGRGWGRGEGGGGGRLVCEVFFPAVLHKAFFSVVLGDVEKVCVCV